MVHDVADTERVTAISASVIIKLVVFGANIEAVVCPRSLGEAAVIGV